MTTEGKSNFMLVEKMPQNILPLMTSSMWQGFTAKNVAYSMNRFVFVLTKCPFMETVRASDIECWLTGSAFSPVKTVKMQYLITIVYAD